MRITFETERLSVAPLALEHTDFMFELLNSEGWIANIGNRNIATTADAAAYIEKIDSNPNYAYLVFRLKTDQQYMGLVTLIKRDYLEDYDIGFAVLPAHQQKGYSYEAINKYVALIAEARFSKKIVAITIPENVGSIRLIQKLGLVYEKEILENDTKLLVYGKEL
jgi:[ribosomal protein S5]-alanine N-acetyltransferase